MIRLSTPQPGRAREVNARGPHPSLHQHFECMQRMIPCYLHTLAVVAMSNVKVPALLEKWFNTISCLTTICICKHLVIVALAPLQGPKFTRQRHRTDRADGLGSKTKGKACRYAKQEHPCQLKFLWLPALSFTRSARQPRQTSHRTHIQHPSSDPGSRSDRHRASSRPASAFHS